MSETTYLWYEFSYFEDNRKHFRQIVWKNKTKNDLITDNSKNKQWNRFSKEIKNTIDLNKKEWKPLKKSELQTKQFLNWFYI